MNASTLTLNFTYSPINLFHADTGAHVKPRVIFFRDSRFSDLHSKWDLRNMSPWNALALCPEYLGNLHGCQQWSWSSLFYHFCIHMIGQYHSIWGKCLCANEFTLDKISGIWGNIYELMYMRLNKKVPLAFVRSQWER